MQGDFEQIQVVLEDFLVDDEGSNANFLRFISSTTEYSVFIYFARSFDSFESSSGGLEKFRVSRCVREKKGREKV